MPSRAGIAVVTSVAMCVSVAGAEPMCACVDFDADGDADLADLVAFQAAFAGSQ